MDQKHRLYWTEQAQMKRYIKENDPKYTKLLFSTVLWTQVTHSWP